MTCDECGKAIHAYPCACGYQPNAVVVQPKKPKWIVQYCTVPGCDVAIRVPIESPLMQPICKWCERGESHAMNGKPAVDVRLKATS